MRLVRKEEKDLWDGTSVHDISSARSTLGKILYKGNRVSLYIKVLLYTVIKIVLMKQGFIQDLS